MMIAQEMVALCYKMHVQPFAERSKYHLEMLNEVTVILIAYHLVCFSPLVPDINAQKICGWTMTLILVANLVINISLVVI